ncbi:hypothetical protein RJT34_20091 [Clitoria ternatea]|uniref:Uncharacterized protein n=1 Tax=Clitoria ternatea TaxID=43366 RepID=A0AAN9IS72_CLITE
MDAQLANTVQYNPTLTLSQIPSFLLLPLPLISLLNFSPHFYLVVGFDSFWGRSGRSEPVDNLGGLIIEFGCIWKWWILCMLQHIL